jgi:hypothetical protein
MRFKGKFSNIRKIAGQMNQTEARYADQLKLLKIAGEIEEYYYEAIALKLPGGARYCPDFMVIYPDYIGFHEVKGSYRLDAVGNLKFKQARDLFPFFRWVMIAWKGKKEGWVTIHDNKEIS